MRGTPEQAQEQFVEDIAPELHRKAALALYKQEPGRLAFSDGIVDPVDLAGNGGLDYALLRRASAHHLQVDFDAEAMGTMVRIHGHAGRDVRDAIELLGQAGHWPEV